VRRGFSASGLAACGLLISFPLFALSLGVEAAEEHREYRCTPQVKYECSMDGCEKAGREFQDAESFVYSTRSGEISACLWTNCYAGAATLFTDASSGTITAIARLIPAAHRGNDPITVSLTVNDTSMKGGGAATKKDGSDKSKDGYDGYEGDESPFTAVWGYRSNRLTIDIGGCALRRLR
jgi:hypothetical protein